MRRALAAFVMLLGLSCPRPPAIVPPPPPPPPPPPVSVPDGCLALLDGEWLHEREATYRYLATDDGGTLTLTVVPPAPPPVFRPRHFRDAGVAPVDATPADAGANGVDIVLTRTSVGFVGQTSATIHLATGRACHAAFPTTVLDCRDGGLVLSTSPSASFGEACQPPATEAPVEPVVHRLIRPPALMPHDGG